MYYVISQSTDLRCPQTVVKKFLSLAAARKEAGKGNGKFTHANPEEAGNWHHTFKRLYYLKGRINRKDKIFSEFGTSCYPRDDADNLASYVEKYGEFVQ